MDKWSLFEGFVLFNQQMIFEACPLYTRWSILKGGL